MTDRLRRTPKGTIGCICSASGFTESLINDVEQHRSEFEILLFDPYEIYGLFVQGISILDLIDKKRRSLRCDGTMWFLEQSPLHSVSQYVELPPSYESLQNSASSIHIPIQSSHLSDIVFARTPLIFDEFLWGKKLSLPRPYQPESRCLIPNVPWPRRPRQFSAAVKHLAKPLG